MRNLEILFIFVVVEDIFCWNPTPFFCFFIFKEQDLIVRNSFSSHSRDYVNEPTTESNEFKLK